ncbi:MAG: transposase [Verrucomicrobiales bacterium]|nr:transposase [Verrucomicrobiales bacterium]
MIHSPMPFEAFNPESETQRSRRNLPHWVQSDRTYFVTFRLADSLPRSNRDLLKQERLTWLRSHGLTSPEEIGSLPKSDQHIYHNLFSEKLEALLDNGYGNCVLKNNDLSSLVKTSLHFFDSQRYHLDEYVIMPNHVHLLVCPIEKFSLSSILHSWKRHSAREINRILGNTGTSLWMDENFDHIVRSIDHLQHYRHYIRQNPIEANLPKNTFLLGRGNASL